MNIDILLKSKVCIRICSVLYSSVGFDSEWYQTFLGSIHLVVRRAYPCTQIIPDGLKGNICVAKD